MKVKSKKGTVLNVAREVGQLFVDAGMAELVPEEIQKLVPKTTWRAVSDLADLEDTAIVKKPSFMIAAECASCHAKVWFKWPDALKQTFFHCGAAEKVPEDIIKRGIVGPPKTTVYDENPVFKKQEPENPLGRIATILPSIFGASRG
jgi:hypothetical protein